MSNEIPSTFCNMTNVEVLSLNGLGGADSCEDTVTIPLVGTTLSRYKDSDIPSCLWSLRNLTTLHLTGNGFVGKVHMGETNGLLDDLSLSHNRLEGTIPRHIQTMKKVDLSHNRFVGYLSYVTSGANDTVLKTIVNRLSGRLPLEFVENIPNLDVLRGNKFSCETIPQNDAGSHGYNCGKCNVF